MAFTKRSLRTKVRGALDALLRQRGLELRRKPLALLQDPKTELRIDLEMVVADLLTHLSDIFFIQVGAFDGVTNDPLHALIRRHHWSGILVEPQSVPFQELQRTYRGHSNLTFVQAAVSSTSGVSTLHCLPSDGNVQDWRMQQASLSRQQLRRFDERWPDSPAGSCAVRTVTITDLLDQHQVSKVDLLQIDAEGHDLEVLRGIDFSRAHPWVIQYEHHHLTPAQQNLAVSLLLQRGYRVGLASSVDTIAYRRPPSPQ